MPLSTIVLAARGGASLAIATALVAGLSAGTAGAATDDASAATTVRLKVGNRVAESVEAEASRPRGLLAERGVELDRDDFTKVVRDGRTVGSHEGRVLRDGDLVKVIRVGHRVRVHRVRVETKTRTRAVDSLPPGKRRVAKRGRDGIRKHRVDVKLRNGRVVGRDVRKSWVRRPKPRVVLVGARRPTVGGTGHLNWGALARCESGGNPRAVNPAGYYGLYQFSPATWRGVGGSGMPHHASPAEQTYRAKRLYAAQGRSPWPHCGRYL